MKNLFIILTLFTFLATGCNRFLDVKSDAKLVVPHTIDDLQGVLDDFSILIESKVPSMGESVSDDYYLLESTYKLFSEDVRSFYTWNYLEYFGNYNDWGRGYQPVYNANLVLDLLKNLEMTAANENQWKNIKGSALFYRSFYFYHLLLVYAEAYEENTSHKDLGIVLRLTSDFNVKSFRSTVQECFDQIESDVKASIELLPDHPIFVTRPSKAAAYALLARLYLYKRDYIQALKYAESALEIKSDLMDYQGDEDIVANASATASPFKQFNKETIFYAELFISKVYNMGGSRSGVVDSILYKSYQSNDQRLLLFYRIANGIPYYKGSYANSSSRLFGGLSTNELYLIRAECQAILHKPFEALTALNQLLENRIANFIPLSLDPMSDSKLLELIRLERRKELVFRGLRFSDIKRYNREGANITLRRIIDGKEYVLEPNSKKYAIPLPTDLVELVGLEQN